MSAMLEVKVDTLFFAQALNEVQIRFVVLGTVVTLGVGRPQMKPTGVAQNAVLLQYQRDDFRHRELLIDPLVDAVTQVGQVRYEGQFVARQPLTVAALSDVIDPSMNAVALRVEGQKGLYIEEAFKIQVRLLANKLHAEEVRLADRLLSSEREHLKILLKTVDGQTEVRLIGWAEHPLFSSYIRRRNDRKTPSTTGLMDYKVLIHPPSIPVYRRLRLAFQTYNQVRSHTTLHFGPDPRADSLQFQWQWLKWNKCCDRLFVWINPRIVSQLLLDKLSGIFIGVGI